MGVFFFLVGGGGGGGWVLDIEETAVYYQIESTFKIPCKQDKIYQNLIVDNYNFYKQLYSYLLIIQFLAFKIRMPVWF